MRNPTYLARTKTGVFYLRWPLPRQLHPLSKITFLKLSLCTREPKTALMIARVLVQKGDQLNRQGIALNMRYEDVRSVLTQHFKQMLEREKARIASEGRLNQSQQIEYQNRLKDTQNAIEQGGEWLGETDDQTLIEAFMKKHQLSFNAKSQQYGWLQRDLKLAYRSYIKSVLEYDSSLDDFDLQTNTPVIDHVSVVSPTCKPLGQAVITLEDVIDRFLRDRNSGNVWAERTKMT